MLDLQADAQADSARSGAAQAQCADEYEKGDQGGQEREHQGNHEGPIARSIPRTNPLKLLRLVRRACSGRPRLCPDGHGRARVPKTATATQHRSALAHASCREATHKNQERGVGEPARARLRAREFRHML